VYEILVFFLPLRLYPPFFLFPLSLFFSLVPRQHENCLLFLSMLDDIGVSKAHPWVFGGMRGGIGGWQTVVAAVMMG